MEDDLEQFDDSDEDKDFNPCEEVNDDSDTNNVIPGHMIQIWICIPFIF